MKYPTVTDPGMRAFFEEGERLYPDNAVDFSLAEQRNLYTQYCQHFADKLLYLHGGGFVVGGLGRGA